MLIDVFPVWVFFLVSVGLVLASTEIGYRIGQTFRGKSETERESPASSISGAVLALLAFMLAFTFGLVSDRYDLKRALVRDEANSIRTVWHRADFLPEADRAKTKALLLEYVARRLDVARGGADDAGVVNSALGEAIRTQDQLWILALTNGRMDMNSDIGALYVESVNELANLHAMRVGIGLKARVPTTVWIVLLSLLTLGMISLGYYTAIADS